MSTNKGIWGWTVAGAAMVALMAGAASARVISASPTGDTGVTTETSAGIVVYPKVRVDSSRGIDTTIQLTNTSGYLTKTHCFYVNANGHCSNNQNIICTQENFQAVCPAGGLCVEGWNETDFRLTLTKRQPVSWSASEGLSALKLNDLPGKNNQFNEGNIPPVPEDPFVGELRCIEVDTTSEQPLARNDLKGEGVITQNQGILADASKYSAIGIPALDGAQDATPSVLNIGGPNPEYNGCPNILTVDHFFEGATVVSHGGSVSGRVTSRLTFVPCAADFLNQETNLATSTLQFLIYNEFEQRFSTSTRVTCYRDVQLSDIDTRPGPDGNTFSIFSVGTQGTLTGMSRIRAVAGISDDGYNGNAVLAVLEENWNSGTCSNNSNQLCAADADCTAGTCLNPSTSSTSANVQFIGVRDQGDQILIP